MKKRIGSILLSLALCLSLLPTAALAAEGDADTHNHPVCGAACTDSSSHTSVVWQAIGNETELRAAAENGSYYLTENVTISNNTWYPANGVHLCLNGHSITGAGGSTVITVSNGVTFTLTDCNGSDDGNGKVTHDENGTAGGVYVSSGGTFHMYGGSITGNTASNGGGVYVYNNGTFEMSGGSITGNNASSSGGGVFVNYDGTFQMSDDSHITGNTAFYGGGVCVERSPQTDYYNPGAFTMSNGNITDNNATYGGGVYISGNFTMSGGEISGNTATGNSGGVHVNTDGTFTVSGAPKITGNTLKDNTTNNVRLSEGTTTGTSPQPDATITIGNAHLNTGASIGVTTEKTLAADSSVIIATGANENDKQRFTADAGGGYHFTLDNDEVKLVNGTPAATKTLSSIAVTTDPTKTTYTAGENFDSAGMVVTATYSDSTTAPVTGYTVTDGNALTAGMTSVTISYTEGGVTEITTQTITVNAALSEFTITFDGNGGTPSTSSMTTTSQKLTSLPNASRSSYTFAGWYTTASSGTQITTTYVFSADTTVYAHWTYSGGSSSGSSSRPSYTVTAPAKTDNGGVSASVKSAKKGDTVTLTVTPDKGYVLETLTVLDKDGNAVKLTAKGDGKYAFTMPDGKVDVKATFMEDNTMLNYFVDVQADDYFYDAALWAAQNGISSGTDSVHFSPDAACTRAQIVTFLWRAAGSPVVNYAMDLKDVPADAYYAEAVRWALSQGITGGTGDGTFSPNAACTREQAAAFLYRASGSPAVRSGSAFTDVAETAYYADAVAWAAQNGVTGGIGNGRFGSGNPCTRAQIVTFLYRADQNK